MTSTAQIRELADVLARERLQRFLDADEAAAIVENIGTRAVILDELPSVSHSPDPMDNQILATAIAGGVGIVSGDKKHMLALREVDGIPIVTAREWSCCVRPEKCGLGQHAIAVLRDQITSGPRVRPE